MGETARYVYAIGRAVDPRTLEGVRGQQGGVVEAVSHRGLDAVVSDVSLDAFGEEGLKRNLEDLGWLEQVARAHDDVVRAVAAHGPTAPLRLATICLDDDGVRARLEEWGDDLSEVLDRVTGRGEWSVKVVAPAVEEQHEDGEAEPVTGAEFLRRRKARVEARDRRHSTAAAVAEEVHQELAGRAVASRLLPPQDPQLAGAAGTMVLNAAYLVDLERRDDFDATVGGLAAAHPDLLVEGNGPWPPYSFAVLEQS